MTASQVVRTLNKVYDLDESAKFVLDVRRGRVRPEAAKAWKIGQALHHCGLDGWSGFAMLHLAGRYGDYIGCVASYLRICNLRPDLISGLTSYIALMPRLFGTLEFERLIASLSDDDDWAAAMIAQFEDDVALQRWSTVPSLDVEAMERAWSHWQVLRATRARIVRRAQFVDSAQIANELKEREAQEYLCELILGRTHLEIEMNARL